MARVVPNSEEAQRIDSSLQHWRQGDLLLEDAWFVHMGDGDLALSDISERAQSGPQSLISKVPGLVVVTQSCDIVRSCVARPYIEVVPITQLSEEDYRQVKFIRRPTFAFVPALERERLVADLERVMTVEKSIVASWRRTPGCLTDADRRTFALALARKRSRFAFPDNFNQLVKKLLSRMIEKHDKNTDEGRVLRALHEIRVKASPSWDTVSPEIHFWFLFDDETAMLRVTNLDNLLKSWLMLLPRNQSYAKIHGRVSTLQDLSAAEYLDCEPLDLDHLSMVVEG